MDLSAENKGQNISRQGSEDRECCRALVMKKIIAKLFGFEKELKAKDMKIHLREGELEAADVRAKDLETDVKGLEQKIIALKKELQTETALKNEAVQVAVDQKNTIEQLRSELAKIKKQKTTQKKK